MIFSPLRDLVEINALNFDTDIGKKIHSRRSTKTQSNGRMYQKTASMTWQIQIVFCVDYRKTDATGQTVIPRRGMFAHVSAKSTKDRNHIGIGASDIIVVVTDAQAGAHKSIELIAGNIFNIYPQIGVGGAPKQMRFTKR